MNNLTFPLQGFPANIGVGTERTQKDTKPDYHGDIEKREHKESE